METVVAALAGLTAGSLLGALAALASVFADREEEIRRLAALLEVRHRARLLLKAWRRDDAGETVLRVGELERAVRQSERRERLP